LMSRLAWPTIRIRISWSPEPAVRPFGATGRPRAAQSN